MIPQFFGQSERPLFGVYHHARGAVNAPIRAAVICPPVGQEYIRTHWCLRLLAGQLARRGIHVLRFDYTGLGDSSDSTGNVMSLEQWSEDIGLAVNELQTMTRAETVMLIGLRMGASLASSFAATSDIINSLILWEPVGSGRVLINQWRELHRQMLDMWICRMDTEDSDRGEELLGSMYSRSLIDEIAKQEIIWGDIEQPHLVFGQAPEFDALQRVPNPMRKVEVTEDENSWGDLRQLETAWLRPNTNRKIVDSAVDIFDRLIRFGVLGENKCVEGVVS